MGRKEKRTHQVMAVFVSIAHLLVKTKQDNSDKEVLVPMRQWILKRHDERL
jgi:hypothetical protein